MLSAGAFSKEGFPQGLIAGTTQSLQLSSAENFVIEIFWHFCPLELAVSLLCHESPWRTARA